MGHPYRLRQRQAGVQRGLFLRVRDHRPGGQPLCQGPGTAEIHAFCPFGNNYLLSVYASRNGYGYAYADVSTGEFKAGEIRGKEPEAALLDEITRIGPTECVSNDALFEQEYVKKRLQSMCYLEKQPDSIFQLSRATDVLKKHFDVSTLDGFGCAQMPFAISAAGGLMQYLQDTQKNGLSHIRRLSVVSRSAYMQLDVNTRRNLELTEGIRTGSGGKNTLLYLLDETKTAMGRRMLRNWIDCPLQDISPVMRP